MVTNVTLALLNQTCSLDFSVLKNVPAHDFDVFLGLQLLLEVLERASWKFSVLAFDGQALVTAVKDVLGWGQVSRSWLL